MPGGGAPETCSQAFDRGVACKTLYLTYSCCTRCDPCGFDGTLCVTAPGTTWISPKCPCDQVVVSGACSYKGCAKPDALGVFSRQPNWRTADGRYVYARDEVQPMQLHRDITSHRAYDATSGSNRSEGVYLYFLHASGSSSGSGPTADSTGAWVIGPRQELTDDNYARSSATSAPCPSAAVGWKFWWGGGISPLGTYTRSYAGGWATSSRYPMQIQCWAPPPKPPPPPPSPPPPPPPPPPMPPPPLRLVPGPYTGRLEIEHNGVWGTICDDRFDYADASVACRQMGMGRVLRYWSRSNSDVDDASDDLIPGVGRPSRTWPVWIENLQCGGEEASLVECGFDGWATSDCSHSEDVHLLCSVPKRPPPPPPRLDPPPPPPPDELVLALARSAALAAKHQGQQQQQQQQQQLSPGMVGALVGGGVGAVVVLVGSLLVAFVCWPRRDGLKFAPPPDDDGKAVHITLRAGPGGLTAAAGQPSEAQAALAAALGKALEATTDSKGAP